MAQGLLRARVGWSRATDFLLLGRGPRPLRGASPVRGTSLPEPCVLLSSWASGGAPAPHRQGPRLCAPGAAATQDHRPELQGADTHSHGPGEQTPDRVLSGPIFWHGDVRPGPHRLNGLCSFVRGQQTLRVGSVSGQGQSFTQPRWPLHTRPEGGQCQPPAGPPPATPRG